MQLKKIEKYKNAKGFELLWPKALICEFFIAIVIAIFFIIIIINRKGLWNGTVPCFLLLRVYC